VPAYPPRRNRHRERIVGIHDNAEPALILTTAAAEALVRETLPASAARVFAIDFDRSAPASVLAPRLHTDGIAFLQYTSGSTSAPKGTIITHENLRANLDAIQALFGHEPEHEFVSWLPPFHDMGLIGCVLTPVYRGMSVTLLSPEEFLRAPVRWLEIISSRQAEVSAGAPNFAYQLLADRVPAEALPALDLRRWRIAFNGAEPIRAETLERFTEKFAPCGFRAAAWLPCYGLAESTLLAAGRRGCLASRGSEPKSGREGSPSVPTAGVGEGGGAVEVGAQSDAAAMRSPDAAFHHPATFAHTVVGTLGEPSPPLGDACGVLIFDRAALAQGRVQRAAIAAGDTTALVSCGPPALDTIITIHDPDTGAVLDADRIGEIRLASPSVARGYWRNPEATAAAFPAEGVLRTGDLGFLHAGELYVTGRVKDLIILRGRNLHPHDVEACVAAHLPGAGGANSIAAFEFARNGAGSAALGLLLEAPRTWVPALRRAAQGDVPAEIAACCGAIRQAVAEAFEAMPALIAFVAPGDFPRTSSGKVQRATARAGVLEGPLPVLFTDQLGSDDREVFPDRGAVNDGSRGFQPTVPDRETTVSRSDTRTPRRMHDGCADEPPDANVAPRRDAIATGDLGLKSTATFGDRPAVGKAGGARDRAGGVGDGTLVERLERGLLAYLEREKLGRLTSIPHDAAFSSLGIDSLAAAQLALEIEQTFALRITEETLCDYPTLQTLAGYIESRRLVHDGSAAHGTRLWERALARMNERMAKFMKNWNYSFETVFEEQSGASVVVNGKPCVVLSSYSYLGLLADDAVRQRFASDAARFGASSHGSRLLATGRWHKELEARIATTLRSEDSITFGTGFVTNWAVISAFMEPEDTVLADEWIHASLVDGCKGSGARFTLFRHNDLEHLAELLKAPANGKTLVVIDAVYSMEGDVAPLPEISALAHAHGAWLMVDEAHSLGVLGARGLGIQEHFGLAPDAIDLKMGTLSKTIPSSGGYIAGSAGLVSALRHNVRSYIFSSAPTPPQVAAAIAGFELLLTQPERVQRLHENLRLYRDGLRRIGLTPPDTGTAIVPLLTCDEACTFTFAKRCRESGLFVTPIVFPAVPQNAPRIRTTITAALSAEDIAFAVGVIAQHAPGLLR
jgi:8-amino-7-oxononanoate synthase